MKEENCPTCGSRLSAPPGEGQWVPKEPTHEMLNAAEKCINVTFEDGELEKLYTAFIAAAPSHHSGAVVDEPKTLMDEKLIDYAHRMRREACGAWSAIRDVNGTIDEAKCQYASAIEGYLKGAIDQIYALRHPSSTGAEVSLQELINEHARLTGEIARRTLGDPRDGVTLSPPTTQEKAP